MSKLSSRSASRETLGTLLISAVGVICFWVLRINYWGITTEPIFSDMSGFEKIARGILNNWDFSWDQFHQSFNPPTLATARAFELYVFGEDFRYWQLFQTTIVFIGLIWLVVEIVQATKSKWLGLGLLWVVAWSKPSIFWTLKLARECLAEGFTYWCVAATLFALRTRHWFAFFMTGCLYTIAFLNRVNFVAVVPPVFLVLLISEIRRVHQAQNKRSIVRHSVGLLLAFLLGVCVAWSPWLARSYKLYGNVIPLSTQAVFFWEMGSFSVHLPDGTAVTTTHAEFESTAPAKFKNDYEAFTYYNNLIVPWLRDNWKWYIGFVFTDRLPRSILQHGELLSKVSRVELFPNFINGFLLDKSVELIVLGLIGLCQLCVKFPRVGILTISAVVVPWFSGLQIIGVPRMLDPYVPLLLFGNLVWIGWIVNRVLQSPPGARWIAQVHSWSTDRRLTITSLGLNIILAFSLIGTLIYEDARLARQQVILAEGPRTPNELVILSSDGKNYLFGVYDSSSARWIPVEGGQVSGKGQVYLHPDQKVSTLLLEDQSSYHQYVPADGAIFLRFYADPSGGHVRVIWRGVMRELELYSPRAIGEWREIQIP
jgi:hypothetical protein